jgi:hypothetical protein
MIDELIRIQHRLHQKILKLRSIENTIISPKFERLWLDSDNNLKRQIRMIIKSGNKAGILKWIKEHPSFSLGEKPIHQLKLIAKRLSVSNYSRLSKVFLIQAIEAKEAKHGEKK